MRRLAAALLFLSACAPGPRIAATQPEEVRWQPAPGLPGMMTAEQYGDPAVGPYQVLIRFPAGGVVQPHYHKFDEFSTVLSGSVVMGQGETIDEAKGVEIGAGGFVTIPAGTAHWAKGKTDALIVRFGNGPRELTPLKPGQRAPGTGNVKVVPAKDIPWTDAPGMDKGIRTAVQYGDPKKGPYILLLRFPAGMINRPHWHSADECATVLSGTITLGAGPKVEESEGWTVGPGGYFTIPGRAPHWAIMRTEVVVTRLANGPLDTFYLDPP